jgi:hypothetical protein
MSVILVLWRYPTWANGTAGQPANWRMEDRRKQDQSDAQAKSMEQKFPDDLSVSGDWARFIRFVVDHWGTRIQGLEICNEPNKDNWPQQGASNTPGNMWGQGSASIGCTVSQMLQTAAAILYGYPNPKPWILGPAFTDAAITNSRVATTCQDATSLLLDACDMYSWKAPGNCIFTHHNYWDVENNAAGSANKTAQVRAKLVGRWTGWPGWGTNSANPELWITEGGVQIGVLNSNYDPSLGTADPKVKHAVLLQRNWNRMNGGSEGVGVGMISQYQFVTETWWDSGIADPPPSGGPDAIERQPAWNTWANLPVYP